MKDFEVKCANIFIIKKFGYFYQEPLGLSTGLKRRFETFRARLFLRILPTVACVFERTRRNLTIAEKQNGASVKQEKWVYSWNPRDQMSKAEKFTGTSDTYAGKVEYEYCLSCDGALSKRFQSGGGTVLFSPGRYLSGNLPVEPPLTTRPLSC